MKRFLIKILSLTGLLLAVSLCSFLIIHAAPGEPTQIFISPQIKPEDLLRIKNNLGLDRPWYLQYFVWLKNVLLGNWGYSYLTGQPVLTMILERVPATLMLMGSALIFSLTVAIPLGIYSALRQNTRWDFWISLISLAGMSLPVFWTALLGILFFSLYLGWLPTSGMNDFSGNYWSTIQHLILPVLVMTSGSLAGLIKYQRNSMIQVLNQPYIKAAKARGLSDHQIIYKHALKNSLLPLITILGLSLPELLGGAVIIEQIFAWPGMGSLGIQAVFQRDYPVIMGTIMLSSLLIILGNQIADFLYHKLDPRINYEK